MVLKATKSKASGIEAFKDGLDNAIPNEKELVIDDSDYQTKPLHIRIPVDLHRKLKLECVSKGYSMREIVEEMIKARYNH